jgi:hypothetical protein
VLQRTRNEQTLKILERLRQQGAPSAKGSIPLDMTHPDPAAADGTQPGPSEEEEDQEDPEGSNPGTSIQDNSVPGSMVMAGLRKAKKDLKRRA